MIEWNFITNQVDIKSITSFTTLYSPPKFQVPSLVLPKSQYLLHLRANTSLYCHWYGKHSTKGSTESKKTQSLPRRLVIEGIGLPHRTSPSTVNPVPNLLPDNVGDPMLRHSCHNCHHPPSAKVSRIGLCHTGLNYIVDL